jgi:hypothetical protein
VTREGSSWGLCVRKRRSGRRQAATGGAPALGRKGARADQPSCPPVLKTRSTRSAAPRERRCKREQKKGLRGAARVEGAGTGQRGITKRANSSSGAWFAELRCCSVAAEFCRPWPSLVAHPETGGGLLRTGPGKCVLA